MRVRPDKPTKTRRLLAPRRRDQRGATAILAALVMVVLFAFAAMAVDIATQVTQKQDLRDTLDAAAHAGAFELPGNSADAVAEARAMALRNEAGVDPTIDLWCVVASTGAAKQPVATQIPASCNPGTGPYTPSRYPGMACNEVICSIPCKPAEGDVCNTIRVADSEAVPYAFAPAIGVDEGDTGAQVSVACKGGCGSEMPNPMDIMFVADRTPSMEDDDRAQMKTAIADSLKIMTPSMHYVALSTIHKSRTWLTFGCPTTATTVFDGATGGTWVPVPFSNDYLTAGATPNLNASSELVKGVSCMPASSGGGFGGVYGTHPASALKHAARYLLGRSTNNLSSLPARPGTVRKAIIFETDGMPDEVIDAGGSADLNTSSEISAGSNVYGNGNGKKGCDNMLDVATRAKAAGAIIITIGFGDANTASCEKPGGHTPRAPWVRNYLAAAASPHPTTGAPSKAETDCDTAAERTAENGDGDYYFCAAAGGELSSIFTTAVQAISGSIKLIKLPT